MKEQQDFLNSFKPCVGKLNEKVNEINKVGDEQERLKKEQIKIEEEMNKKEREQNEKQKKEQATLSVHMTTDTKASMLFINCIVHTCIVHIPSMAVEVHHKLHDRLEQTTKKIAEFTKTTDSQVFYL